MTDVIADLPPDDRPRERLLTHGPETLSDAELVAILLGSGLPGKNAIQLARELLSEGMPALRGRDPRLLEHVRGVGPAKVARIAAAFELSRRRCVAPPEDPRSYAADVVGRSLVSGYAHHRQERLGAVVLDSRNRILQQREIYVGTINSALVSTRDIISFALLHNATGVVVYHNHPSGNPAPSAEDLSFTRKLEQSLGLVDVELVDHLIAGAHRYHSMREQGQI
jgi:DNA repair protein RadC